MKQRLTVLLLLASGAAGAMDSDDEAPAIQIRISGDQVQVTDNAGEDGSVRVSIHAPKGTVVAKTGHSAWAIQAGARRRPSRASHMPHGLPVSGGRLSSGYGLRADPFDRHPAHHHGLDFAAPSGADVVAVADGRVTRAGSYGGYGNLVEIDHGNGYVTRYGHNQAVKVRVGETVDRGKVIASLGSTGRSTGPHVHYEVLYQGRKVDPAKFVRASGDQDS